MSGKPLPRWAQESLETGEDLAALELLGLLEEVAWHFGALPEDSYTFPQPHSQAHLGEPRPLAEVIEEVRKRSEALLQMPEKPGDYAETLATLGTLAEDLATSEQTRKTLSKLNESLRAIIEAEGYR